MQYNFPFPSHSSAPKPSGQWTTFPLRAETLPSPPQLPVPAFPAFPPTMPTRWQRDRSIIACEECHVCHPSRRRAQRLRACPCQPLCQGSWTCQLLHLQRAADADATHLQVNVFWGELCQSAGEWGKPAIQLEQNRLGAFYIAKSERQPLVGTSVLVSRVSLNIS